MKHRVTYKIIVMAAAFAALTCSHTAAAKATDAAKAADSAKAAELKVDYVYNLSNFEGIVPYNWASMFQDKSRGEVYVSYDNRISIFNSYGMEVYTFGDDDDRLGNVTSGAVDKDGNMLLLITHYEKGKPVCELTLCNYRGEPKSKVALKDVPAEFGTFNPENMIEHDAKLYLADLASMKVLVVDRTGKYLDSFSIGSILGMSQQEVRNSGMTGFHVDKDGNIFFTISVNFQAYKLTPDHKLSSFGVAGSAPGRFCVVKGIATDDNGNIYVVDALKATVIVFNKDFKFLTEFGGRGYYDGGLISPNGILIDGKGMVYVTQSANRGVNVYKITN